MALSRARSVALLVVGLLASTLALSVGIGSPATASGRAAPTVSLRQAGGGVVAVAGRTAARSAKVRIDRRLGSHWVLAARTRSHHHRYATTVAVPAGGSAKFKVTSNRRSRTFTARAPATGATATAQAAKTPPTQYDACGARPRKADGTAWQCTFHDDFDGTALDATKWVAQTAFLTGDKDAGFACYVDSPNNISVAGGMLSLTLRKEAAPEPCGSPTSGVSSSYTSGSVSTYHLFSQQYGRYEARIRNTASSVQGLHEAFWLWPDDQYATVDPNNTGEIDVSETYSQYDNLAVPFLHYAAASSPQPGVNTAYCNADRGVWNTYTLEWTPTTITVYVNGRSCLVNTSADPVFHRRYIVNLTQALGAGTNTMVASTPVPATMDIDYVRVWK